MLIFLSSLDVSRIFLFLLFYLSILDVMIRLPLVLVWAWYVLLTDCTVPLFCLQCICIDIIIFICANKMTIMKMIKIQDQKWSTSVKKKSRSRTRDLSFNAKKSIVANLFREKTQNSSAVVELSEHTTSLSKFHSQVSTLWRYVDPNYKFSNPCILF